LQYCEFFESSRKATSNFSKVHKPNELAQSASEGGSWENANIF